MSSFSFFQTNDAKLKIRFDRCETQKDCANQFLKDFKKNFDSKLAGWNINSDLFSVFIQMGTSLAHWNSALACCNEYLRLKQTKSYTPDEKILLSSEIKDATSDFKVALSKYEKSATERKYISDILSAISLLPENGNYHTDNASFEKILNLFENKLKLLTDSHISYFEATNRAAKARLPNNSSEGISQNDLDQLDKSKKEMKDIFYGTLRRIVPELANLSIVVIKESEKLEVTILRHRP